MVRGLGRREGEGGLLEVSQVSSSGWRLGEGMDDPFQLPSLLKPRMFPPDHAKSVGSPPCPTFPPPTVCLESPGRRERRR